jgi:hypothetical protein
MESNVHNHSPLFKTFFFGGQKDDAASNGDFAPLPIDRWPVRVEMN